MVARTRVSLTLQVRYLSCWMLNLMIDVVRLGPWKFNATKSRSFDFRISCFQDARREVANNAVCINDDSVFNHLKTVCEHVYRQVKHSAVYLWGFGTVRPVMNLKAHPFLAIHSADKHRTIYSFSNTTSYSTFYAFFSPFLITLWPMWLANSKTQPCFYPPQSHSQGDTQNWQKNLTNLMGNLCRVREYSDQFFVQMFLRS